MSSSSASGSSLRSFFAIEPECFSSTGDSRHFARVLSQKICAVTLPFLAALNRKPATCAFGLGLTKVELIAIVLAQSLRIYADHPGDIVLGNTVCRHGFDLTTLPRVGSVRPSSHQLSAPLLLPYVASSDARTAG